MVPRQPTLWAHHTGQERARVENVYNIVITQNKLPETWSMEGPGNYLNSKLAQTLITLDKSNDHGYT